jgi:hypothetical protein
MRRKDREITEITEIEAIIEKALVCRLGLYDGQYPYVVPLSFGYADRALYFHCAPQGKKLDILRKNNRVCFEMDTGVELKKGDSACAWGMRYQSVIGFGSASILTDPESKRQALDMIMAHYTGGEFSYTDEAIAKIVVVKVDVESMTGKKA